MKQAIVILAAGSLFLTAVAHAQTYSIYWKSVDGGGNTSTSASYRVDGTIGQPDAGLTTGSNVTVHGGFWSVISLIQTPDAPHLSISQSTNNSILVSWPSPSTGFTLWQNSDINTTNWVIPAENVIDNGTNKYIRISPQAGSRFYRLLKP